MTLLPQAEAFTMRLYAGLPQRIHFRRSTSAAGDAGSAVLEFGLAAIVFLTLLFGLIESAFAVYVFNVVSQTAQDAARYAMVRGSTLGTDCSQPGPATCTAQTGDIQTYAQDEGFPGINPDSLSAYTTWLTSSGENCGTTDACKAPGNQVQVTVVYQFPWSVPFLPQKTLAMSSTSQMVIAQ